LRRRVLAIAKKELIQILRDPRSLAVAIAFPVALLVLYGYGINLDVRHLRTAVLDMDRSSQSRALLDSFQQSGYFDFVHWMASYGEAERLLDHSRARLAIVVPRGFAADLARGSADVQVIIDGSDASTASVAVSYATRVVQAWSQEKGRSELLRRGASPDEMPRLDLRTRFWYNPELRSNNFIVPGLVAVILMLLSSLLTSLTVVREVERGTMEQILVSPIRPVELMVGKLLPYMLLAFMDVVMVIMLGRLVFHVPLVGSPLLLLGTSLIFLLAALSLGLLISSVARSQLVAMTIAVIATMLPTILLSGFVFPISTMPTPIRVLTHVIPARYYLVIVRGIFLKGVGISVLWPQALMLLVMAAVLVALASRRFRRVM